MKDFNLEEITDKHTLRRLLAKRFLVHKDQKNPDVRHLALAAHCLAVTELSDTSSNRLCTRCR